jgi:hypothetical protein
MGLFLCIIYVAHITLRNVIKEKYFTDYYATKEITMEIITKEIIYYL